MATIYYTGLAPVTRQLERITISSVIASASYNALINGKTVSYAAAASGETTSTIAAGLFAAIGASQDPEWRELSNLATNTANTIDLKGVADGAPFTLTVSASSGTPLSRSTITTSTGPRHADNVLNYSGGALPIAGDDLVFADSVHGPQYALNALAAIALGSLTRRAIHTGRFGLPTFNLAGYRESRPTEFQFNVDAAGLVRIETNDSDAAEQIKLQDAGANNVAIVVVGTTVAELGAEVVEIRGTDTSPLSVNRSSVAIAKRQGQDASLGAVTAVGASVALGPLVNAGAIKLSGGTARLENSMATLATDRGAVVEVASAGSCSAGVTIDGGPVAWNSSGTPTAVNVGSGGVFDLSNCPVKIPSTNITLQEGGSYVDPEAKNTMPYNIALNRTELSAVGLNVGTSRTLAVS